MNRYVSRRVPVTAVHQDDLERVLRRLNVYDEVARGEAECFFCGRKLSLENIGGFMHYNGSLILVCDNSVCLAKAALLSARERARSGAG